MISHLDIRSSFCSAVVHPRRQVSGEKKKKKQLDHIKTFELLNLLVRNLK